MHDPVSGDKAVAAGEPLAVLPLHSERLDSLARVSADEWDQCSDNPFLQHAFLAGLEQHHCLQPHGWYPQHLLLRDDRRRLIGALPLYRKTNSYGEFVFDWSWAEAYERYGLSYYPKLVNAIPHTPSIGPRFLIRPGLSPALQQQVRAELLRAAEELLTQHDYSSLHCLFPEPQELDSYREQGLILRRGHQFHWHNRGYRDFADFLDGLTAKRRKQIKRERRSICEQEISFEVLSGRESREEHWQIFYDFYCSTFARKWGEPRLTLNFFLHLAETQPDTSLLFLARRRDRYIAGAFALRGSASLHGRHWGCCEDVAFLHFELCYYRTIDYCIATGLQHLDAGAQGDEHKFPRGFEPVLTTSAHRIADPRFAKPIAAFVAEERRRVEAYIDMLREHSPYRSSEAGVPHPDGNE